ncbi:MAG TPA: prepilin-type N-terminal cleavage/methylation domain-containing protein [Pyrinomonadaceae bacterium]|nr:prepilin-type N-terminal cleavage/methylation domain-containing protein [Pyrinomonadaceae bacterium]
MKTSSKITNQAGFSLIEMLVACLCMATVTGAVVALMKSSISISNATYEMTDAQEGMRSAQEIINRDLVSAGDGLKTMTYIPVTTTFVQKYLSLNPVPDPAMPTGVTNLGILTTDNDVPANTTVYGLDPNVPTSPLVKVRSTPNLTDRQTILSIDSNFVPIALLASKIDSTGTTVTISDTDRPRFSVGEIYFFTSSVGGTFGTVTAINDITGADSTLTFAQGSSNGDKFGLNVTGTGGRINTISAAGTLPTTLQRMKMIHYYIDDTGRLVRRVFGVKGAGFREGAVADHVTSVQFIYSLGPDSNGNNVAPVSRLSTLDQQIAVRQVEVRVNVETPHKLEKGLQPELSSTTATSVRNMQFRQALQPRPTPTP